MKENEWLSWNWGPVYTMLDMRKFKVLMVSASFFRKESPCVSADSTVYMYCIYSECCAPSLPKFEQKNRLCIHYSTLKTMRMKSTGIPFTTHWNIAHFQQTSPAGIPREFHPLSTPGKPSAYNMKHMCPVYMWENIILWMAQWIVFPCL